MLKQIKAHSIFLIILSCYLLFSTYHIMAPGLSNDEVNYINITLNVPNNGFYLNIYNIPLYIMDYIGALKSYFFKVIFFVFNINIYSLRLPLIILGFISAIIFYLIIENIFSNKYISNITSLIMILDSTYIIEHRFDLGPVVFELFFKLLSFYLILKILAMEQINRKVYIIVLFVLLLGLYNKLNFIWYINALFMSFIMVYATKYNIFSLNNDYTITINLRKFSVLILSYILFLFYTLFIMKYFSITHAVGLDVMMRYTYFKYQLYPFITNTTFTNNFLTRFSPGGGKIFATFILAMLFLSFMILKDEKLKKIYLFILFIFIFLLIQIAITPLADKTWHLFSLYPFYYLLIGFGLYVLFHFFKTKNQKFLLFIILFISILTFQINNFLSIKLSHTFKDNFDVRGFGRTIPTMAIYDLSAYVKSLEKNAIVITTDWGMSPQLQALNNGQNIRDLAYFINNNMINSYDEYLNESENIYVVTKGLMYECLPDANKNFFNSVDPTKYKLILKKKIYEDKILVYTIYKLEKIYI